jgi:hypothetical protein
MHTGQRTQRTRTLLARFAGLPDEFVMLKGVLCASHGLVGTDSKRYAALFDSAMIATRMDAMNAEAAASFKRAA